jgi:peptidoglycan/LPS O-acetylase OafA/YrhL
LGVLLANIATFHVQVWNRLTEHPWVLLLIAFCLIFPVTVIDRASLFGHTATFTLLYLGFGALLVAALGLQGRHAHRTGGLLHRSLRVVARAVAAIGVFSYGIYIWHIDFANRPVNHHLSLHVTHLPAKTAYLILLGTYMAMAIAAGAVMTMVIEFPSLRLRDRLFPRVRRATQPAEPAVTSAAM